MMFLLGVLILLAVLAVMFGGFQKGTKVGGMGGGTAVPARVAW